MVVTHSEQPPISFRLPPWLFPALIVFLGVVASSCVFYFRAYRLGQELEALKSGLTFAMKMREREMRDTILSAARGA